MEMINFFFRNKLNIKNQLLYSLSLLYLVFNKCLNVLFRKLRNLAYVLYVVFFYPRLVYCKNEFIMNFYNVTTINVLHCNLLLRAKNCYI